MLQRYRFLFTAPLIALLMGVVGFSCVFALIQERGVLDSTTMDSEGNTHLETDVVRGMYRYDTTDEPWTNPAKYNFTGWGADGKKYVHGLTNQMQGQVSYEGNVLPSREIHGQQWEWVWNPPLGYQIPIGGWTEYLRRGEEERLSTITQEGVLQLHSEGISSGGGEIPVTHVNRGGYSMMLPELTENTDWVIQTRMKGTEYGNGQLVIWDGTTQYILGISCNNFGGCSFQDLRGVNLPFSYKGNVWRTYTLRKTTAGINIFVDGEHIGVIDYAGVPPTPYSFLGGGTTEPNIYVTSWEGMMVPMGSYPLHTEVEIDFFRFEIGSDGFTKIPRAPWSTEISGSDRGVEEAFPDLVMIATDEEGISILNLRDNARALWMRFHEGVGNAIGATGVFEEAQMRNGKLVIPKRNGENPGDESDGLYIMDFTDGFVYQVTTEGYALPMTGIEQRNSGLVTFGDPLTTQLGVRIDGQLTSNEVRQVTTAVLHTGDTYVGIVEDPVTVGVVNLDTHQRTAHYTHTPVGIPAQSRLGEVALAKDGTLYVMEETSTYGNTLSSFYEVDTYGVSTNLVPSYQKSIGVLGRHIHVLDGQSEYVGNRLYWTAQRYITEYIGGGEMYSWYYGLETTLVRYDDAQGDEVHVEYVVLERRKTQELHFVLDMLMIDQEQFLLVFDRGAPTGLYCAVSCGGGGIPIGPIPIGPPSLESNSLDNETVRIELWDTRRSLDPSDWMYTFEAVWEVVGLERFTPFPLQVEPPIRPISPAQQTLLRNQSLQPFYLSVAYGGSVSELLVGSFSGILETYMTTKMNITSVDGTLGVETPYVFTILPAHPVPSGSVLSLQFSDAFTNWEELTPADFSLTTDGLHSASYEIDSVQRKIHITIESVGGTPMDKEILFEIGGDGLQNLRNPMQGGLYTISYDIITPEGAYVDSGFGFVPLLGAKVTANGGYELTLPMTADVQETMYVVFDTMVKSLRIDPLVNDGRNTTAYSTLTIGTNAPGGYGIYARLDDGTGVNQLSNGKGNAIPAGLGENTFGFEATKAPYDPDRVVEADTYFEASDTIITSNGESLTTSGPSNPIEHTLYYDVDVDFSLPAGHYGGTIYFSVLSNF